LSNPGFFGGIMKIALKILKKSLEKMGFKKESKAIGFILKSAQAEPADDELHIYDFDGTLFRSPQSPAVWDGDWWSDPASLTPPCVPSDPGQEWWISSTVDSAKKSISNPNVWAIMMTGRKEVVGKKGKEKPTAFRYRVPDLLQQAGLNFDEVHLSTVKNTMAGKLKTAIGYLNKYPTIKKVKIWDDRPSHLQHFKRIFEKMGKKVEITTVNTSAMKPLCDEYSFSKVEAKKKPTYIGIFLDSSSKSKIIENFSLKHDEIKNDHVTLAFAPTIEMMESPEWINLIGQKVSATVVGYAEDDKGQAAIVSLPPEIPYLGESKPHVTITHDKSVGAKYSNDLISREYNPVDEFEISGIVDAYPRMLKRA